MESAPESTSTSFPMKRLNMNLPEPVYKELQVLAKESGRSMTDLMRMALGLAKVAVEETNAGNKLYVVSSDGKPIKQLVLPR